MPNLPPILVVDDNTEAREFIELLLQMHGPVSIAGVASAEEALERLEGEPFGLIICDYHLGGMDGVKFVECMRARGDLRPVLLLTGDQDERISAGIARHPHVSYFTKPFTLEELTGQIDQLLAA